MPEVRPGRPQLCGGQADGRGRAAGERGPLPGPGRCEVGARPVRQAARPARQGRPQVGAAGADGASDQLCGPDAAIGDPGASPWLFPGGQPGQPISAYQLAGRLRQLGIRSGQSRSAALFQLATDLPAVILARLLGIHITVAAAWQRAAAGDWAGYAGDISHCLEH